jgi:hypothetical protein
VRNSEVGSPGQQLVPDAGRVIIFYFDADGAQRWWDKDAGSPPGAFVDSGEVVNVTVIDGDGDSFLPFEAEESVWARGITFIGWGLKDRTADLGEFIEFGRDVVSRSANIASTTGGVGGIGDVEFEGILLPES